MKLFSKAITRVKQTTGKKLFLFAMFLVLGLGLAGITSKVAAAGTGNDIMSGGASSCADFINKIQQNTAQAAEWRKIYAWNYGEPGYGLQPADYNRFATSCQHGVAYRNNTIVVGGRVVATSVWSIGRFKSYQGSNPIPVTIPNAGNYFGNYNSQAFADGTSAIPVDVLFNPTNGKLQFAVMTNTCGNTTIGHPTAPTYICRALNATRSTQNPNQWSFTTDANAGNGATITKLVYNYGDGNAPDIRYKTSDVVNHTFTRNSTVTVSVYVSLPGGGQVVLTNCTRDITFVPPAPVFTCDLLSLQPGTPDQTTGKQAYILRATATMTNGTITSYVFTYGDGSSEPAPTNIVAGSTPRTFTVSKSHTYAPGKWAASVRVYGKDLTGRNIVAPVNVKCAAQITVQRPECKPGVPQNDSRCYDYTCNLLTIDQGNNDTRTVTIKNFSASTSNPNAKLTSIVVDWGDNTATSTYTSISDALNKTHQYGTDVTSSTVTAVAHFTTTQGAVQDIPAGGENCAKPVSYTTPVPPTPPTPPAPTQLINTGAGSVFGLFGVTAVIATVLHRIFLGRRLNRQV